jgi:hypothetical protein
MTRLRTITIATSIVAAVAAAPSTAAASPLLSGYGGPGQGNQAILGSALLNGPGGGSSGGSSGSTGSGEETSSSTPATGSGGGTRTPSGGRRARRRPEHAPAGAPAAPSPARPLSSAASVGSQPLGLSGTDVFYVVLGCGALIMTASITRMLVRRTPGPGKHG